MKRIFVYGGIAVGAVVALIIVATIFIFSSLDGIVQTAVEKFGTEIVGANVELLMSRFLPPQAKERCAASSSAIQRHSRLRAP